MKKIKLLMIILVLMPMSVLAYSDYIIAGGETLGIKINSDGVMVIGFYEVNGKYNRGSPAIKVGDYITHVNGVEVDSVDGLTKLIEESVSDGYVNLTVKRSGKEKKIELSLIKDKNIYKTGLYVKDSITGTGTLTYIDPETKIYGALGHEIVDASTNSIVEIKSGEIFRNYITSIDKSKVGYAGSKNAKFYFETKYGSILKNTNVGIYGLYTEELPLKDNLKVANPSDIKIGKAKIATVLEGEKVEYFNIEITKIDEYASVKNIYFEIIDNDLLDKTSGVVQGMSGSPIMQDNMIIGAVTHVIIDNPTTGYGLFITTMLEEGERELSN